MTPIPAYHCDPRLTRLDTEVTASGDEDGRLYVVLADTVLYPEGGGQPPDHGTVGGVAVTDVQKAEGGPRHYLAGPAPSGAVTVELDWARRFDHMQQHTAQHLLTAVADARFGWHTTSFHLGDVTCDIEVDAAEVDPVRLAQLEEMVAAEIRAARPVTTRFLSPEEYAATAARSRGLPEGHTGDVRLVEIEGIDVNTCGGTHVSSTAEIEALKLLDAESMRGGTRLTWVAGRRLRRLHEAHHQRNARLREILGTSDDDLPDRVAQKLDQLRDAEKAVRGLQEELADATAQALAAGDEGVVVAHWPDRPLPFLQKVAREVCAAAPERVVFLTAGEGEEGAFVLAAGEASTVDVAAVGREVAEVLGGRGGGSGKNFQGKATRMSARDEAAAKVAAVG